MKIAVVIASHQRHQPLNIVLRNLPPDWHAVVVVSTAQDAAAVMKRPNTHVHTYPNEPLGAKWQHAVDKARLLNPDLLIITGSDDVLLGDTTTLAGTMEGVDMLGFNSFLAYDGRRHYRCTYRPHVKMPIGGGRVYTRALLDRMRWKLFDTTRNKWLDEHGHWNARRNGARILIADEHPGLEVIALKGEWPQKNPLQKYLRGKNIEVTPLPGLKRTITYQF